MTRTGRSTGDDEFETPQSARARAESPRAVRLAEPIADDEEVDPRLLDLDADEEPQFLRAPKRPSVRRGPIPRRAADRIRLAAILLFWLGLAGIAGSFVYRYGAHSWRFRVESSDDIQIAGIHNVTHAQVMDVFGGDLGRNVFFVPLADRKRQLEQIPWVESATVMRLLPSRLAVQIKERTPVAFAQVGARVQLIDASGVLMDVPPGSKPFSFPVIVGMNENEPLSTRAARMRIYTRVMKELDSEGARNSQDISEVDVREPDDARVTYADNAGTVLVHLGDTDFLARYKIFKAHLAEWRQRFQKLDSVDLRYERQVIVNADAKPVATATPPGARTPSSATGAAAAKPGAGRGQAPHRK
jgi:cell division protein FtsQ